MMQKKFGLNLARHEHECFKSHMRFINQRIINILYGEMLLVEHTLIRVRKLSVII
jgi:hypothetical protein